MLGSLPKSYLAHAVAKLSCVGITKPFNQPTDRPASHSLYQLNQIWMLLKATHHSAKPRILTKNSSLRCGGYMPEAGSSWTPTGHISQAAEGKRFVLAARWSHSTPPPVWWTGTGQRDCWRKEKTKRLWGPADLRVSGTHPKPDPKRTSQSHRWRWNTTSWLKCSTNNMHL